MNEQEHFITVNDIPITVEQVNSEVQYHPSDSLRKAKEDAKRALVIRELLLQEAVRQDLCDRDAALSNPESMIEKLLDQEIDLPEPDRESCERYYKNNIKRFTTAAEYEVSHIFFPAPPGDTQARDKAMEDAGAVLDQLRENPALFEKLAMEHSACPSKDKNGSLGTISRGQTVPAFEKALPGIEPGTIAEAPVATEVGIHIIRVDSRKDSEILPFDTAYEWIAGYLRQQSWQRAVAQYISILAGKANITGFDLQGAETPLVQ